MVSLVQTKSDLEKRLANAGDKIVIVDFYASWCGPCRTIGPFLDKCAQENQDVIILKIDVDENSELCKQYNIMLMPTIIFFKNSAVIKSFSGSNYAKVVETLKELQQKK